MTDADIMKRVRDRQRQESEAFLARITTEGLMTDRAHGHVLEDDRFTHVHLHAGPHEHEDAAARYGWGGYYPSNEVQPVAQVLFEAMKPGNGELADALASELKRITEEAAK